MRNRALFVWVLLLCLAAEGFAAGIAVPKAPVKVRGNYDLAFDFYDGPGAQANLVASEARLALPIRNGRFSVSLHPPSSSFATGDVWLQITASPGGTDQYHLLLTSPLKIQQPPGAEANLIVSGVILRDSQKLALSKQRSAWRSAKAPTKKSPGPSKVRVAATAPPLPEPVAEPLKPIGERKTLEEILKLLKVQVGGFDGFVVIGNADGAGAPKPMRIFAANQVLMLARSAKPGLASGRQPLSVNFLIRATGDLRSTAGNPSSCPGCTVRFYFESNGEVRERLLTIEMENARIPPANRMRQSHLTALTVTADDAAVAFHGPEIAQLFRDF